MKAFSNLSKKRVLLFSLFIVPCSLFIASCLSPWEGDNGTLTISVGRNSGRAILPGGIDTASLSYTITVKDSSGKTQSGTIQPGGGAASFSPLALGTCTITAQGYGDNGKQKTEGTASVVIKPGQNAATVITGLIFNVPQDFTWIEAVNAINTAGNGTAGDIKNYIINITGDGVTVVGGTANTFTATYIKVSLRGPGRTVSLSGNGYLIRIGANQEVVLRDLTLQGHDSNNNAVVSVYTNSVFTMQSGTISGNTSTIRGGGVEVNGGTFTMHGGEISGNTTTSDSGTYGGGGVVVAGSGTFIMQGGAISGNTATIQGGGVYVYSGILIMSGGEIKGNTASIGDGGGVCVDWYGTFTMYGGEIKGNTAYGGGGVYVIDLAGATFRMVTGTIYGSDAGPGIANTASNGAALWKGTASIAQRGTFSGDTWNGTDLIPSGSWRENNTIRVRNGVLQ